MRILLSILLLASVTVNSLVAQREWIPEYRVRIEVKEDRSIEVTEDITVAVQGNMVKRGITRALPNYRNDPAAGQTGNQRYDILSVSRDAVEENYLERDQGDDLMLYLGDEDIFLDPGTYRYKIKYRSPNQVALYEDFDEITWNAIGQKNQLDIGQVAVTVVLPNGTQTLQYACYTGRYGSTEKNCSGQANGNTVNFTPSVEEFAPGEGFTVSVGFPKGVVAEPTALDRLGSLWAVLIGALGFIWYGFTSWRKHGIDPPKPTPYPLFSPPRDHSPAELAYLTGKSDPNRYFAASIVSLAVKGYLHIIVEDAEGFLKFGKQYRLQNTDDQSREKPPMSAEEQSVHSKLFQSEEEVLLKKKYDSHLASTLRSHSSSLSGRFQSFITEGHNLTRLLPLIGIFVATLVVAIILAQRAGAENVFAAIGSFGGLGVVGMILYGYLINKPTPEKLKLQSEIEGFRMYLAMAEKDRLQLLHPPEMTVEHYEEMLPYAYALKLDNKWSNKFATILAAAHYRPDWNNNHVYFSTGDFGSDFQSVVGQGVTPPSSSGSGSSGGGGFSGGGGGGGGVGGW